MSAPCDGLSLSDEAALSQLRQRFQRDMNCLSDPDRSTRRRALTKLQKAFFQEEKIPESILRGFLTRFLGERLVGMLADGVEKCREMAGGLLLSFVDATIDNPADTAALAKQLFAMAEARVGSVPLIEPAEEIRALLLRLCNALLRRESSNMFGGEVAAEACAILSSALTDPFPEVKRECCALLLRLAAVCPGELRSRLGKVLRPLVVNLGHQHSKSRQLTLQALGELLLCGSDDLDKVLRELVLPQFRNLLYDRTLAVRRELANVLASLIDAGIPLDSDKTDGVDEKDKTLSSNGMADTADDMVDDDNADDETALSQRSATILEGNGQLVDEGRRRRRGGKRGRGAATAYLEPFRAELVALLMSLLADDADTVCEHARTLLMELGEAWGTSNTAEVEAKLHQPGTAETGDVPSLSPPAPPFPVSGQNMHHIEGNRRGAKEGIQESVPASNLPPPASLSTSSSTSAWVSSPASVRAFCSSLLPRMMPMAIEDASHWTVRGRRRALWLLCFLVRYAGDDVTPYLPQLLGSLEEASRDDEVEVCQAVEECAGAVGREIVDLSAVTDVLLPVLRGEVSGECTSQRLTQVLAVLRPVLSSASIARPAAFAPLVGPVSAALCGRAVLSTDPSADGELWEACLEACRAVVDSGMGDKLRRPRIRLDLLRALLWLLAGSEAAAAAAARGGVGGSGDPEDNKEEVLEIASALARENACDGAQDLFSKHFTELLSYVVGEGNEGGGWGAGSGGVGKDYGKEALEGGWDRGSRRRAGFEALLRSAPRAVGLHVGEVMPIFRGLLHDPTREPELRLSILALLECVLKQAEVTEDALRPHAQTLMREMVVPNAVWRAGMVAATVRKVAVAVLYTALRGNKIGVEALYNSAEQLLPILKTNLEDHDAHTRQMSCLSLEMIFRMMPGALGEEPVRLIYPELLKRLDDSNDAVRRAVCGTMSVFFRATAPQNVRGTVLNYSVEQLLVHLDDQDESMQQAVFTVLEVAAYIDPQGVRKLASAARSSHRSPDHCDRLLAVTAASK